MKRTTIKQLFRSTDLKNGEKVRVAGWIRSIRANNNVGFVSINDGSFFDSLQVVIEKDKLDLMLEVPYISRAALFLHPMPNSLLNLMQTLRKSKVNLHPITPFRRSAILTNTFVQLRIFAPEQIHSPQFSV